MRSLRRLNHQPGEFERERIFMAQLKAGIVGLGVIGGIHLRAMLKIPEIQVVGIADSNGALREAQSKEHRLPAFESHLELIDKARPDYLVIGTPHYSHTGIAMDAMNRGVHVFVEKPLAVAASRAEECVAVARKTGRLMGVNFGARLRPVNRKMHDLVRGGFLGRVSRVTMVCTAWFRNMAYYRSSPWRATWSGEGGGILVNQSPHDLDLLNWTVGLPSEVFVEMDALGHDIEVEDDVVGILKWSGGATGMIHVTTNEAPGRHFLEVAGARGTLLVEGARLKATKLAEDSREFSKTSKELWGTPAVQESATYELPEVKEGHLAAHRNFVEALQKGTTPFCSGEEALREVQLANALLLSGVKRKWVSTPVDSKEFEAVLAKLVEVKNLAAAKAYFEARK